MTQLLSEHEAAIHLGITPELLFEYTRYAPKTNLGDNKKLKFTLDGNNRGFWLNDLDDWNHYLQEHWAKPREKRPKIPPYIQRYLKVECGGKCALCGTGHKLEDAHIVPYEQTLAHYHHNLIRLCTDCHSKFDDGIIATDQIQSVKTRLIENLRSDIRAKINFPSGQPPFFIPQPNSIFVGREVELSKLEEQLVQSRVIVIQGVGGIGKTQLLLQALIGLDEDTKTIWLDVESYTTISELEAALSQSIAQAGFTADGAMQTYSALHSMSVRVVLDGLDQLAVKQWDAVLDFVTNLIRLTERPKFVITTQIEITYLDFEAYQLKLQKLSIPESEELLRSATRSLRENSHINTSDLTWLTQLCDGHPLSLKLIVGLIKYYKKPGIVVERLKKMGSSELKDPQRKTQQRLTSLDLCISSVYSCLNHSQKRLLLYLASFPAGCMVLAIKSGLESEDPQVDIAELSRFFLIETHIDQIGIERTHVLNPIRIYTWNYWKEYNCNESFEIELIAAEQQAVLAGVLGYQYISQIESSNKDDFLWGLARIDVELPNFIRAFAHAKHRLEYHSKNEQAVDDGRKIITTLASSLSEYMFLRGIFKLGIDLASTAVEVLRQSQDYDQAVTHCQFLSNLQERIHDDQGVQKTVQSMIELAQSIEESATKARISMGLGDLAHNQREFEKAIRHYKTAADYFNTELNRGRNDEDKLNGDSFNLGMLSLCLSSVGRAYEHQRRPDQAKKYYLEALEHQLKISDWKNLGATHHQLANCYSDLGDTDEALVHYKSAVKHFVDLGQDRYLGNSLAELGRIIGRNGFSRELDELVQSKWLYQSLDDVASEIEMFSTTYSDSKWEHYKWGLPTFNKLLNIIKFTSFKSSSKDLISWSSSFINLTLSLQSDDELQQYQQIETRLQRSFFIVASLAKRIGSIVDVGSISEEQLFELCGICLGLDEQFDPDAAMYGSLRSLTWLEHWLKHWQLRTVCINADELYDMYMSYVSYNDDYDEEYC